MHHPPGQPYELVMDCSCGIVKIQPANPLAYGHIRAYWISSEELEVLEHYQETANSHLRHIFKSKELVTGSKKEADNILKELDNSYPVV